MRKLTLSLAVMAALLPARGYPLGLGEIELNSALNQELNADIEILSASPEDAEQLIVQLGSREAFNRAGIDRPYLLQQLNFKVVDRDGAPYIKVTTNSAVREPFLSFLLEIDWPQGNLLREYTLLLDPPVYNTGASAGTPAEGGHPFIDPADTQSPSQSATQQYYPRASATGAASISSDSGRSMSYQAPTQSTQTRQSSAAYAAGRGTVEKYRVKENDTLWSMASRMRPDESVSVEQMMLALVRKNPEAFIQENINGVKRGYILRVPDQQEALQINRQQALAQAREHAALWREYSRAAGSATPASAMEAEPAPADSSSAADAASGQLSIVGASEEAGSEHAGSAQAPGSELERLQQELAYAREQLESERVEKETLRSRLSDLEQKVQSVINMDDAQLAELQQSLQQDTAAPEPAEELATDDATVDELAQEVVETAEVAAEMAEDAVDDMVTDEVPGDETTEGSEAELTDEVVFADELAEESSAAESVDEQMMDSATDYSEPETAIEPPPFAQKQPKSFIDRLMNDQKMLSIIGGGLAIALLLLALLLKRMRGRKADTVSNSADSLDIDDATMQNMDATTEMMAPGYEKADAMDDTQIDAPTMEDEPVDSSEFSLDEAAQPAAEADQDDVLAEADVYLAYGIYQQAEDLLKKAIEQNPERDDYRMKLLEVHYAAKDTNAFEQLAQEVHSRKGDDKTYWGRVAAMGAELVPGSALFAASGDVLPDFDADAVIPGKPATTDLELDVDEQALDTTELELPDTDESATGQEDELDLASDLAEFENEAATEVESTAETDETDVSSELEFDLGELSEQDDTQSADESLSAEDELDLEDEDFSLDFDAADLGFEEPEDDKTESESATDTSDELNLDEDLDLSVALDEGSDTEAASEAADELDLDSELSFDASELNLDDESRTADDEISLDMDDAGLDLEADTADLDLDDALELTDDSGVSEIAAEGDEDFDISELSEDIDEVSTKLDLAKAYIDMGDSDGARSILEEVKAEGNEAQQQEAEALLQKAD